MQKREHADSQLETYSKPEKVRSTDNIVYKSNVKPTQRRKYKANERFSEAEWNETQNKPERMANVFLFEIVMIFTVSSRQL